MGYKYKDLDYKSANERSCYIPGRVYRYKHDPRGTYRLIDKDLLLCIHKFGDCLHKFVRLEFETRTYDSTDSIPLNILQVYFNLKEKVGLYGGMEEAFPEMRAFNPTDLVHILCSGKCLILYTHTLTHEELKKVEEKRELQDKLKSL